MQETVVLFTTRAVADEICFDLSRSGGIFWKSGRALNFGNLLFCRLTEFTNEVRLRKKERGSGRSPDDF